MSESFISYRSFHEALKELSREQYGNVMYAINEYALNQIEIELQGIEKVCFTLIKPQLDANIRRQEHGTQGGRPKKNEKNSDENKKPMVSENAENKKPMVIFSDENKKPNKNDNDNYNENENLNLNSNQNENGGDDAGENTGSGEKPAESGKLPPPPPSLLSDSQKNYSQLVFDKFRDAGLPCQRGDFFRFQACDFRLALQKLKGYSSQDVLAAVDNYIAELKNPESYVNQEYSFDNFVGTKTFSKCLPENYRPQNFKIFASKVPKAPEQAGTRHFYENCPKCGQKFMEWKDALQVYKCDACGNTFSWEEIDNAKQHIIVP